MRIPRVKTLYLAGDVLLTEHEEAASGAHSVTVEVRNQKESRVKSILCGKHQNGEHQHGPQTGVPRPGV
jgi:hypothetical protein